MELPNAKKNKGLRRINSMNKMRPVLMQLQHFISTFHFQKAVDEHNADKNVRSFSTWNLLTVMIYTHFTHKKSLRDICTGLQSLTRRWYHLGLVSLSRNNLSNSLAKRPAEVFEKTFYMLLDSVQGTMTGMTDKRFRFKNPIKAIDSTTLSLCISLYAWASFRKTKAGIKVHTVYDIKNQIPDFICITDALCHDHTAVPQIPIQAGALYALDRGYFCLKTLENINKNQAFFVTRLKSKTLYSVVSKTKPKGNGILADQSIVFTGIKSHHYPGAVRLVRYRDTDGKIYHFITNNYDLSAATIAAVYKARWDIELFFKWVKQNLRLKTFIGTSENAVRIQIWTAAITYLLVEYIRFVSRTTFSKIDVFRILGSELMNDRAVTSLFEKQKPISRHVRSTFDLQLDLCF